MNAIQTEPTSYNTILVTGSRRWTQGKIIRSWLQRLGPSRIIHGACPGADLLAAVEASRLGIKTTSVPADWRRYGHAAGPIRNQVMVDMKPDLVLAFVKPDSRGTLDTIQRAKKAGISVIMVKE